VSLEVLYRAALTGADASDFDRFVDQARGGHAFQTRAWAAIATADRRHSARFFLARADRVVGAAVVLRPRLGALLAPIAHVDRGPVCREPEDLARVLPALALATRATGVVRLTTMPYWAGVEARAAEAELARTRFGSVQDADGAHVATLRIDIGGKTDREIVAGGDHGALRRKLRQAERAGAVARRGAGADVRALGVLHTELMLSQRGRPSARGKSKAWWDALAREIVIPGLDEGRGLPARGAIFVCEHRAAPIASLVALRHGSLATFAIGATSMARLPFSKMVLPMMEALRWARDAGCTSFDLGGVPMAGDTDAKRIAIAQFKLDFAKSRVHLVGEHARWL
jgi:Acetyltransferase (GNAT) domain